MFGFLLFVSLISLIVYTLWKLHYTETRRLIDKLPGPPALPFLGNVLQVAFLTRQGLIARIQENAKLYRPVYRTWYNTPRVHISDPRHVEILLSNTQNIPKSSDYKLFSEWLGTGLLTSNGSKWHKRRKQLTPAFHFKILEQFVPVFSDNANILVDKLRAHQDTPEGVDITPLVTLCALDIICESAMGTAVNAQLNSKSLYVSTIREVNYLLLYRIMRPWLQIGWIAKFSPAVQRQKQCVDILQAFTKKVIREKREELKTQGGAERNDQENSSDAVGCKKKVAFLDLLIGLSEEDGGLSDEDIREEVDTFMFEGHDTTATGMSWALFFLATNPSVQDKCVSEMSEIFCGSDRSPTMSDLGAMKYLERAIKETLRLRPSVFLFGRTLDQNIMLDNYEIPKGTDVQIHILNVHRHPEHYPDPERFDPDRFLPENCVNRHPFAYIPFSAGQRNCIGQKFALLEEKCVLSTILRHFELRAVNAERDKAMLPDLILRPEHGLTLRLTPRVVT